ncbi:hypothetical protein O6H91_17G054400 [Diphasiastrum complanatum]|nr:hypothetical protein O6H91_17G054400 [Diphasiastrum complanatum]
MRLDTLHCQHEAGDLAQKCRHLESDLEQACSAFNVANEHILSLTSEKNTIILDLEHITYQLEEYLHASEWKRAAEQKDWEIQKKQLEENLLGKERREQEICASYREELELEVKGALMEAGLDEERQKAIRRTLENEAVDCRARLTALEQTSSEAELRHLDAAAALSRECEGLRKELKDLKNENKASRDLLSKAQKEVASQHADIERLCADLCEALRKSQKSDKQAEKYRDDNDELQKKLQRLNGEVTVLEAFRERYRADQIRQLEELQGLWDIEKDALLRSQGKSFQEIKKDMVHRLQQLKMKQRHSQKQLAKLIIENGQLLLRLRECEAQLAVFQNARLGVNKNCQVNEAASLGTKLCASFSNHSWLENEMAALANRQSTFLGSSS